MDEGEVAKIIKEQEEILREAAEILLERMEPARFAHLLQLCSA